MEPVQTSYFINGLKNIAGNFKKKTKLILLSIEKVRVVNFQHQSVNHNCKLHHL